MKKHVWYQLVTETGEPYDGCSEVLHNVCPGDQVGNLLSGIYETNKPILQNFALSTLKVYLNRKSLLEDVVVPNRAMLDGEGIDGESPLLVVVPNQAVHNSPNPEVPRPSSPWQNVGLSELPQKIIEELNKPETQVLENRDENEPHGYVKFSFPASVVGISPCLVSDRIMKDVRMIDPEMLVPVDQVEVLLESGRCVALIGVSGCGKTRTCYDLCRSGRWYGLYFDWSSHIDLAHFKDELESIRKKYLIKDYEKFLERSETVIKKILICRLLVLQLLISKHGGTYCKKRFLLLQQCATTRDNLFVKIAGVLTRNPETHDIHAINQLYGDLIAWSRFHKICCIFDEAQVMLTCQKDCYSSSTDESKAEDGKYVAPRSFLSLIARFVLGEKLRTVWAGTHLRLGDVSRLASAAGDKPEQSPRVFKDFNFLTPTVIKQLLDKWLRTDSEALKLSISRKLAGRPRFLCSFIEKMHDSVVFISDKHLALLFANFYESISKSTEFENSMMKYIIACEGKTIKEFAPVDEALRNQNHLVIDRLIDLLYDYFLMDIRRFTKIGDRWYDALVSTSLIMLSDSTEGRLCEHVVADSAIEYFRSRNRDVVVEKIIRGTSFSDRDEASRGKAVELICAVRLREGFFNRDEFHPFFSSEVCEMITGGILLVPEGLVDCRTGDKEHADWLRKSFLNPNATHVVLPEAKLGGADVVYGCFSFHIKTKWSNVNSPNLIIPAGTGDKNHATIDATWKNDGELANRVRSVPWIRICFELPLSGRLENMREMGKLGKDSELVSSERNIQTITADIRSSFTRKFFGAEFIRGVVSHMKSHRQWYKSQRH
jgi:hypothetical protein